MAVLAEQDGWYANLVADYADVYWAPAPGEGEGPVKELAAMFGLWHDLAEVLRSPGVCGFLTGTARAC